jgi:hypothetical protein
VIKELRFLKDEKKTKPLHIFLKSVSPFWLSALIIGIGGFIILDILYPPKPFQMSWEGVLMFLTICAGVGWMIHGTGFLIVKVSR